MWARVTRVKGTALNIETIVTRITDLLLPAIEGTPGFSGGLILANRKNGQVMIITLWREEKDIKTSDSEAANWRAEAVKELHGISPPEVELYEAAYLPVTSNPEPTVSISFRPDINKFARVTRIKGAPHEFEAVVSHFRDITVPVLEKLSGYSGGMLFIDRETSKLIGISVWLTEADLIASASLVSLQRTEIANLFSAIEPPEIEYYEFQPLPAQVPG
jgi:heme-degrading monooxygenase HmoA